jgi:putative holliday junction resolvase
MNILGVDFGTKNIGLAWVETGLGVVLPFGVIKNEKNKALAELAGLIKKEKIEKIVFGLPLNLDGGENANTKKVRMFAGRLEEKTGIRVYFESEIFSSRQAGRAAGGASRDEKAAMIILEDYLKKK